MTQLVRHVGSPAAALELPGGAHAALLAAELGSRPASFSSVETTGDSQKNGQGRSSGMCENGIGTP